MQQYCARIGNIVDRRRAEMALQGARVTAELASAAAREATFNAEAANRAKSQFLANMSHELRTPLNAIIGFSEVIASEGLGPLGVPRYGEYARDILTSGEHLLGLINDILDLARIEAGKAELHEELIEIEEVVAACLRLVRLRAEEAGVTLATAAPPRRFGLLADQRKLSQIIINMLSNAVKFTPEGGSVTVSWELTEEGECRFAVSDTGIGIKPEDLSRVLSPFEQVESPLNRRHHGTGLGLALTRGLAELHGGSFALESTVGTGTLATVTLPAGRVRFPPTLQAPAERHAPAAPEAGARA